MIQVAGRLAAKLLVGIAPAAAALALVSPSALAQSWSIESTSIPSGAELAAVSCPTASFCMAVGTTAAPFAARWDGSSWTVLSPVKPSGVNGPGFTGVSCTSASFCVAVGPVGSMRSDGFTEPLVEEWNGASWSIENVPISPADSAALNAVSCTSTTSCTAAGSYVETAVNTSNPMPFADRWNGIVWTPQEAFLPSPGSNSELSGVSCSAARACTAVGYQNGSFPPPDSAQQSSDDPYAASWSGAAWGSETTPMPPTFSGVTQFQDVSCAAAGACTAVGSGDSLSGGGFVEQWNGSAWTADANPVPDPLYAVSCPQAGSCIATGGYNAPAAYAWDGSSWTEQTVPVPVTTSYGRLAGVSCDTPGDCTAVGVYQAPGVDGASEPLVEHYS